MLPLNANLFRYAHENSLKIMCSFCENEIEGELHFICLCPENKELRKKHIDSHLQNENSFAHLMQCQEKMSSQNLALFVFHACKKSEIHMLLKHNCIMYAFCLVSGDSLWVMRLIMGHRAVCDCDGDGWGVGAGGMCECVRVSGGG